MAALSALGARKTGQFFYSGEKFSLAPGFSPVMMVEKRRKAVLTASEQGNPLKRVLSS
jgi:hypothetical protein